MKKLDWIETFKHCATLNMFLHSRSALRFNFLEIVERKTRSEALDGGF